MHRSLTVCKVDACELRMYLDGPTSQRQHRLSECESLQEEVRKPHKIKENSGSVQGQCCHCTIADMQRVM